MKLPLKCAAGIVLILAAYASSLHNSFHFDDAHVIETNRYIRSLSNIPRFFADAHTFSSLPQNATYRPLVTLTLALDYARGGLDPEPYHVTQIALLIVTFLMLVAFFVPMAGEWPSVFAATLFCIHTANTETMNLISARSELLSTIGLLGSFLLYQRSDFARRSLLYLIPLAIGALAKAPLVVFAPLLFFYAMYIEHQPWRRAARIALPSLILGVALLVFLNTMNAPEWVGGGGSALHYTITQPFAWLHYFRLFLLPIGLTADTDWTPFAHWYDTRAIAGDAFVILLIVLIVAIRRARPVVAFGLAWFAVALIPTSSFFPLAEIVNEHRVFFAFAGLVLAAAVAIPQRYLAAVAVVVLVAHLMGTYERNLTWRSEASLWTDVVEKSPGNGRAWMNRGLTKMGKGDVAGAKSDFDHAATLVPNYWILEINRGIDEGALGDQVAAEAHFKRALALNADANAHYFYARWLVQHGRGPEALDHVREAVRLSPAHADAETLLLQLNRIRDESYHDAWPTYDWAFRSGLTAIQRKDWYVAVQANRAAASLDPNSSDAWNNLGWSLAQLGFRDEAARAYEHALAIKPDDERVRNNLALLRR